jgi:signal transduction histidine kinase
MSTFKTRARAVDMLGRQQIAGIPTAISELFKNAHDAYADKVIVDYYRSDGLFVLRDDGLGMTRDDFESRWLTLGTESKLDAGVGLKPPPVDPEKPLRPILGEKGIGRLAIAVIGPQLLILSRAKRKRNELTAAFIHWGLFECPGINLDQIDIPIETFTGDVLPNLIDVDRLVNGVRRNIKVLRKYIGSTTAESLEAQLNQFKVDPREINGYLGAPNLLARETGTQFFIQPAYDSLVADIEGKSGDDSAPPLIKMLVGFTNTMTPNHAAPPITAEFRDHRSEEVSDDLIGPQEFFTPEEFTLADHHFNGKFDQYGQFSGAVTIYGQERVEHVVPWPAARGKKTECGPFKINLAYLQGAARESAVSIEDHARLLRKLNRIGGIYIYKDGIRVLPYGSNDYDFLNIERNRTKSASYYFFSYRRMFGVIEISQTTNVNLNEKAGREGFRENKAYRQFREILMDFFSQIAADFFREGGVQAELFSSRRAELDRLERARRKREQQVSSRRRSFNESLETFFASLEQGKPQEEVSQFLTSVSREFEAAASIRDQEQAVVKFINIESSARHQLGILRDSYKIAKPRGVGLTKQLRRDWDAYLSQAEKLEGELFAPASTQIEEIIGEAARRAQLAIDRRRRFERILNDLIDDARKIAGTETRQTREAVEEVKERVLKLVRESMGEVDEVMKEIVSEFARLDVSHMQEARFSSTRDRMQARISMVVEHERSLLEGVRDQLNKVDWSRNGDSHVSQAEMTEALEEEVLALRERSESDLELTQLGMAINVIGHEFGASIKTIRDNLRRLKSWANVNQELRDLYGSIRTSFDHLDAYLTLFTPLQRRLYRQAVDISGSDIFKFLNSLFEERLRRHTIRFEATPEFRRYKISGYPSTFYPVFANLIDNALFWLRDAPQPRTVRLDRKGDAFLISNTGPRIPMRDRDSIFEIGFTRKPGGRGLGLHISRQVLAREGYNLTLDESDSVDEVTFRIAPEPHKPRRK